jgi:hypothetical protein
VLGLGTKSSYDETMEGEALRAAIVKFVDNVVSQINTRPWSCRVAFVNVKDKEAFLNAGFISGLQPETILVVYHLGEEIKDPTTGLSLGYTDKEIAQLKVIWGFGEDGSVAAIISGNPPSVNDICRLKE